VPTAIRQAVIGCQRDVSDVMLSRAGARCSHVKRTFLSTCSVELTNVIRRTTSRRMSRKLVEWELNKELDN